MINAAAAIAANRFGLGARPGELEYIGSDAHSWLEAQIGKPHKAPDEFAGLSATEDNLKIFFSATAAKRGDGRQPANRQSNDADAKGQDFTRMVGQQIRPVYAREVLARTNLALNTDASFQERLARFWSNHFTVSAQKPVLYVVAGNHEREAIRPHVQGSFRDLLLAATLHPAMLLYLDNALSFGPRSAAAKRGNRGLNENLAREILELHTLGVDGGYSQEDVIELARALTGWTTLHPDRRKEGGRLAGKTHFIAPLHEPGKRTIMGKTYADDGEQQALRILHDLALHPATARHLSYKLARHFISDTPPADLVTRLAQSYLKENGSLPALYRTLVDSAQAWEPESRKLKQPEEFALSALRALGVKTLSQPRTAMNSFSVMGQQPFLAPSPAGWPDDAASWAGSDAVMRRLQWASQTSERLSGSERSPVRIAEMTLGPLLQSDTRRHISSAPSVAEGLTLFLMSPEFQRR